uniref:Uncharacterized protein n=1 Tax=Panagrolaimus superbus TaxID=310955 RepID=A0A914YPI1_9BILA
MKLLNSSNVEVVEFAMSSIRNIAYDIPKEVFECIKNENINIFINHLGSRSRKVCDETLGALTNLISENSEITKFILDSGALKHVESLLTRVPSLKLMTVEFIEFVTKYQNLIDPVIHANILPSIFKFLLNDGIEITEEIKIVSCFPLIPLKFKYAY